MSGDAATLMSLLVAVAIITLTFTLNHRQRWTVFEGQAGLLYRDGQFVEELGPGRHTRFDVQKRLTLHMLPTVPVVLQRPALTVMSKDQFSFRVSAALTVRVTDARIYQANKPVIAYSAGRGISDPNLTSPALDAAFAEALLTHVGQRTLEEFVADPRAALGELATGVSAPGLMVEEIRITEVQVPPEVRKMFTEVERARREGLAQLERARGEQASLRALANAARALQDNPRLADLRLWQLMEGAKGNKTFVLGKGIDLTDATATGS